jgi:Fe-S cluster assembly protein SufD
MSTLTQQNKISDLINHSGTGFESARNSAKEIFKQQGMPALKAEEYKFTSITKKLDSFLTNSLQAKAFEVSVDRVKSSVFEGFEGDVLVFSNGIYQPSLSDKIEELSISSISAVADCPIGSIAKPEKDIFCALNQASFQDGVFISIPNKVKLERPVLFLFLNEVSDAQVIQPRIWIESGDFSEATFIEQTVQLNESPTFVNKVIEVKGGMNTHLHHYRLQNEGKNYIEVSNIETDLLKDSTFTSVVISLSGDMIRNNLTINILGSNSEGNMYGLYLLNGKSHVDNHTNVDHTVPHSESNELYKGIMADYSRGVFNGKIFVRQDAQKTNAFQQNNNILLSENAVVNTKPQLEIWADDVKCSHGCTTGQLDEEALFYLQARGIGKLQAKGLLLYAFAGEVLEHIGDDPFKKYCTQLVENRLGSKF